MRLGRLPWINTAPVFAAMDRGVVSCGAEVVTATAAELNDLLAAGELDVSAVSAVEYARDASLYHLLPNLAISCDGPVHSVALFSKRPVNELDGATVLRTASSRTSVLLLELLCKHRWQVSPQFATVRAEPNDLAGLQALPHDAVVDGDFAVAEGELQAVLTSLRGDGINVVAIHHHMTGEAPRILFLHYWGRGKAVELASAVRRALDKTDWVASSK